MTATDQHWEDAARCLNARQDTQGRTVVEFTVAPWVKVYVVGVAWWTVDFLGRRLEHPCRALAEAYAEGLPRDWLQLIRDYGC